MFELRRRGAQCDADDVGDDRRRRGHLPCAAAVEEAVAQRVAVHADRVEAAADVGEDVNLARLRTLFRTLASNIASLAVDDGKDITVIASVMEVAIGQWKEMRLNGLMAAVAERGSDWLQRYQ